MNKKLLPWLITVCALGLGGTAAYYSVIGLSMLFAGAATAVIIMASFLELSKLTLATLLHSYWDQLNKISKIYYIISLVILSILTSAGIYGMLSSGYQKTADQTSIVDSKVASLETKKKLYENTRAGILQEKQSLSELKGTLSKGSTTQFTDRKGNLVVRSNNASIKQIENASKSDEKLSSKLDVVNDSIFSIESKILEVKTTAIGESELGPLKYLSKLTGVAMDQIINWYILVIIFVFDPLAIALVIAANFAFAQLRKTPINELTEEDKEWLEAELTEDEEELNEDLHQTVEEYKQNIYGETPDAPVNDINEEFIKSLDKINEINDGYDDFFNKKRKIDEEIDRIKAYEKSLKNKKDDTITIF